MLKIATFLTASALALSTSPLALADTAGTSAAPGQNIMNSLHQQMLKAGTPAERHALMQSHMAAMQAMLKTMPADCPLAAGANAEAAHQHMGSMHAMMQMMMSHMGAAEAAPAGK